MNALVQACSSSNAPQVFGLDPAMTVKDATLFIEHCNFKGTQYNLMTRPGNLITPEHEMYLVTRPNKESLQPSDGIRMENSRTIASYRLKEEVFKT